MLTMSKNVTRIALGGLVVFGSALAFLLGAHAGARLDHGTRAVTVAHPPSLPQAVARR